MATMIRARLLIIRSGIIILAFFGIAFLWLVSDVFLPDNLFVNALLGAWSIALFFFFLDFSVQLGQSGGLLNRIPKDDWVFDLAAAELEADQPDEALWAKLFVRADGAQARREAIHIRLMAKQLKRTAKTRYFKNLKV
jgi:hypothetical protein